MYDDIDCYNAKRWVGKICFLPSERQQMKDLFNLGFIDAFRYKNPDQAEFSWWDYRFQGWIKNHGLRIDYLLCNANAINSMKDCTIDKSLRALEKPSDHTPVIIELII